MKGSMAVKIIHMQDQKFVKLPGWIVESVHSLVIMVQPTLHPGLQCNWGLRRQFMFKWDAKAFDVDYFMVHPQLTL